MSDETSVPAWAQNDYDPTAPENSSQYVTPLYTELQNFLSQIGHNPHVDDEGNPITDSSVEAGTPPSETATQNVLLETEPPSETAVAPRLEPAPPPSETAVSPPLLQTPPPSETAVVPRPSQSLPRPSTTPADKPTPSTTPAPTQRQETSTQRIAASTQRPAAPASPQGGMLEKIFSGVDFQSNHRPVVENGVINWGNPDNPADFARASKVITEMMYGGGGQKASVQSAPSSSPRTAAIASYGDGSTLPILRAIRTAESSDNPNAKNPRSSAGGLYQFTDGTWGSVLRRMAPDVYANYNDKQLSTLKSHEKLQEMAAKFHLENDILPKLAKNNIPATPGNIYLSWFQGPDGAVRAYNAPDNAFVAQVFPGTVTANAPMRFNGKPYAEWTMRDLRGFTDAVMARRMRADGGRLIQDEFPTHYMSHVGRQVMNDGGVPADDDAVNAIRLAYEMTSDPMGNPTVAQSVEQPEGKREGLYERAVDLLSAPIRTYAEETKKAAEEGSHMMSESGKSLKMEDGRLPINALWQYPLGAVMTLASPLTGAAETLGKGVEQATGNKQIGERAAFVAGMVDPTHAGLAMKGALAAIPMVGKAEEAAKAVQLAKRELTPLGFYSHGEEMARTLPQEKGTPEQFAGMLAGSKYGVKPVELEGFREAFADRPTITRDEAAEFFRSKLPQLDEVRYGANPRYQSAIEDFQAKSAKLQDDFNITNQSKIIDGTYNPDFYPPEALPHVEALADASRRLKELKPVTDTKTTYEGYTLPGLKNYQEAVITAPSEGFGELKNLREEYNELTRQGAVTMENLRRTAEWYGTNNEKYDEALKAAIDVKGRRSDVADKIRELQQKADDTIYSHRHWPGVDNPVAHIRWGERAGPNGEKILHIDEVQSDWGQRLHKIRKEKIEQIAEEKGITKEEASKLLPSNYGIRGLETPTGEWIVKHITADGTPIPYSFRSKEAADEWARTLEGNGFNYDPPYELMRKSSYGVPPNPYIMNTQAWTDLALKRILKEAAEGGYDKISWTPGAEQAKRFSLSNEVSSIHYEPTDTPGVYEVFAKGKKDGNIVFEQDEMTVKEMRETFGREIADKILKNEGTRDPSSNLRNWHILTGDDLNFGGEGMLGYYDKILPAQLSKLTKRLDPEARISVEPYSFQAQKNPGSEVDNLYRDLAGEEFNPPVFNYELPTLTITPKMRENILKGLTAYADGGAVDDNQAVSRALEMTRHLRSHS